MKVRRSIGILLAACLAASAVVGLAAPASAAGDTSLLAVSADVGDYVASGQSYLFEGVGSQFTLRFSSSDTVGIDVASGDHLWGTYFRAPSGEELLPGLYTDVQRWAFAQPPHPGLEVSGEGHGCGTVTGWFAVHEIVRDPGTQVVTAFAATFEQHCDGAVPALRGSVYYHSTLPYAPAAALTLSSPQSQLPVGSPVALSGTLVDGAGPVTGAQVTVTRTDADGSEILVPSTTGADGSFTAADRMPSSSATWTAHYAGSATVQPLYAHRLVLLGPQPSTLVLGVPATATRTVGYRVGVHLTTLGVPLVGALVSFTRTDLAGTRNFSVRTNTDGRAVFTDVPAVGGGVSWTARYAGSSRYASAKVIRVVTVSRSSTALSIRPSALVYAYGARATITVHLGTTYNRRDVYVYAKALGPTRPVEGPGPLVLHGRVNASGNLVLLWTMRARTTFTVRFPGDYRYLPATRSVAPNVRARVTIAAVGYSSVSGGYYVVRTPTATVSTFAAPVHLTGCNVVTTQKLVGAVWTTVSSTCVPVDPLHAYVAVATIPRPSRWLVRVRAYAGSTPYRLGAYSPWLYIRFV